VLGDTLIRGQGVAVDRDAAAIWYERAALQGHAGAIALYQQALAAGHAAAEADVQRLRAESKELQSLA
jgi:TPR repeat protein